MMQGETPLALQEMINRGTDWLSAYLREFEAGAPFPSNTMLGIFEGAAGRARLENSLEWAGIALRAAELWALEDGGVCRHSALLKAMQHRAGFISRMGSRPGDPVLDKASILQWFTAELEFPIDVAKEKGVRWRDSQLALDGGITLDELKTLRNIRSRVQVLQALADCGEIPNDSPLTEWLEMERLRQIP